MPALRGVLLRGDGVAGGIVGYPSERLMEEVAYIAYHFHWPMQEIMALAHLDRRAWVEQIARINERRMQEA